MNEQIEYLFDQALEEFKAENKYTTIVVPDPLQRGFVEKFAELIVQECAIVANEHVEEIEGVNYGVGRRIKNHFGVE